MTSVVTVPPAWREGEVAVIGLARSGVAATRLLLHEGLRVYASDGATSPALEERAAALREAGAAVDVGHHDLARIRSARAAIVSPGIPPDAEVLVAARAAGVTILAELDLAARALAGRRLIVITGTNGKSTTTALTAHLLTEGGLRAAAAGNIGRPLAELALEAEPPEWIAVEASSFQLHDAPDLDPAVGVVTNLSPNHLDRYHSVEEYYADKQLLFRNATPKSVWVLNGDDPAVLDLADDAPGTRRIWRVAGQADAWYDRARDALILDGAVLLSRAELPLVGDHNVENALAAALAARAAGVAPAALARGLQSARALPHRLELVREVDGIRWINDSKATSVAAAAVGVRAMDRPFVVLMGGRHKGEPYTALAPLLDAKCRGVVAFGESAPLIVHDLGGERVQRVETLDEAIQIARELAQPGDTVLLSPACSSFDQFTDYEERGAVFRRLVKAL